MLKKVFKATPILVMSMIIWLLLGNTITVSADWQKEADGSFCYISDSGEKVTGFQKIGDNTYYFDKSGKMLTKKWVTTSSGSKYYLKKDGSMATGKVKIGDNTYYFGKSGKMWTSKWLTTSSGTKYYFRKDGSMAVGKVKIGEKTYEFDSKGRLLASKLWKPYNGIKWNMTQSEVIEALNLKEDDYEFDDNVMLTINEDEDILGPFLGNVYVFTDEKLIAIGSCGIYSEENLKILKDEFEKEGFIYIPTNHNKDTAEYSFFINKEYTGGILQTDEVIMYLIFSNSNPEILKSISV